MKRYLTILITLVCAISNAQNLNDVLRYGSENIQGTARYQAMGGAFGALGGDFSSLNINPAGSAVFNNSLMTITGTGYFNTNDALYYGNALRTTNNNLDINQIGGAFVFNNTNPSSDWKKISLAFNYDVVDNYENQVFVSGNSTQGLDNYFSTFAQGVPFGNILVQDGEFIEEAYLDIGASQGFIEQQAFLGYYGGFIDPVTEDNDNVDYVSNADYASINQNFSRATSGYNNKFTVNVASQYQENIYIGASLNFHNLIYTQFDQISENSFNAGSRIANGSFDNYLQTTGNGFSFSLGAIAKVNESVRLGGSYQSPTWYRLDEELSQRVNSNLADADISFIDFNIINVFDTYTLKTPAKFTGSLGLVFGQNGLLSFDYGYQDFSQSELRPTNDSNFQVTNNSISNELGAVSTFRLGGEYRIQQISLRGGYRFEQSPYANGRTVGDLNSISAGIGYNFGGSRLDFAISRTEQDRDIRFLGTGFSTPAILNRINTNASVSYTINF